jgi:hypothetical protein
MMKKYRFLLFICFLCLYHTASPVHAEAMNPSKMNPAMAAVGEFGASISDDPSLAHPHELLFHGGDLDLYASVDPYFKAELVITFCDKEADFEEAYLESMTLPAGLKMRVGKFKTPFGKWNTVHGHALPVINMPLSWERLFGEEGLNESGIALSELLPFLPTYHEIIGMVLNGDNTTAFNGAQTRDMLYLAHLKNFFELGGYRTLEAGFSFARGRNSQPEDASLFSTLAGANLIFQWKHSLFPLEQAFTLWSEVYHSRREVADSNNVITLHPSTGFFILGKLLFLKRWYAICMYDNSGDPLNTGETINSICSGISFQPSEFSEFKLEYRRLMNDRDDVDPVNEFKAMLIFTIGAHGPHAF